MENPIRYYYLNSGFLVSEDIMMEIDKAKKYNMKISFDFDGTLDREEVQSYAKKLVDKGIEVHIVTARYDSLDKYTDDFCEKYNIKRLERDHNYLFEVANEIGISADNIHFMNMNMKYTFFKGKDFIWHLDDDSIEVDTINKNTDTKGISCMTSESYWKSKCNKLLDKGGTL